MSLSGTFRALGAADALEHKATRESASIHDLVAYINEAHWRIVRSDLFKPDGEASSAAAAAKLIGYLGHVAKESKK